jgi:Ni/Fe-hydrogenase subunit HybB-like protein
MSFKKISVKSVMWLLVGIWIAVSLARFARGLGATTALTDAAPWGLWIAFDVMSGVALAAGGFVISAVVYVFHLEKYRPFARPAILTAFLGYVAVAVGLMYDLGVPLHIWHPIVYQQRHSVLFEVAMCVMLYLTVLFLEFCPVILEHPRFDIPMLRKIHKILKKATIPLVVTGIVLSTLHQSSLGSLFLIAPYRVHPLWYSPIIWVLFFVSAVGLGLMTIAAEALFSSWYFGHKLRTDLLSGLGKAASVVLFLYAALRLGDLALRGTLSYAWDGSWQAFVFLLEIGLAVLLPATLLSFRTIRTNAVGLGFCSVMTLLGMIGYRFNLCIVAFARPEGMSYFPTWMEISVTLGIVAVMALIFIFFVENLRVCVPDPGDDHEGPPAPGDLQFDPYGVRLLLPESMAAARRYSLAAIAGIAVAAAMLPDSVWQGRLFLNTSTQAPRVVDGWMQANPDNPAGALLRLSFDGKDGGESSGAKRTQLFLIDGNRNGRLVAFPHDFHRDKLGMDRSCVLCHHMSLPFDQQSTCHECHADMYVESDIFNHASHVAKLGDNASCTRCHDVTTGAKTRSSSKPCGDCHREMVKAGSTIPAPKGGLQGFAGSYMDAMHGLCINCHKQKVEENPQNYPRSFAECAQCHRDIDGSQLRQMNPYAAAAGGGGAGNRVSLNDAEGARR